MVDTNIVVAQWWGLMLAVPTSQVQALERASFLRFWTDFRWAAEENLWMGRELGMGYWLLGSKDAAPISNGPST